MLLPSCGSNRTSGQVAAGGVWQAQLIGGESPASTFSFIVQFTINADSTLNITYFQLVTSGPCMQTANTPSGTLAVTTNANNQVVGPLAMTVTSASPSGNTLTLNGNEVGGTITGTWSWTGSGNCNITSTGQFTMTD